MSFTSLLMVGFINSFINLSLCLEPCLSSLFLNLPHLGAIRWATLVIHLTLQVRIAANNCTSLYFVTNGKLSDSCRELSSLQSYLYIIQYVFIWMWIFAVILRAVCGFRVFECRMQRGMFGLKRDRITGVWRKLHNEESHNFYCSLSITSSSSSSSSSSDQGRWYWPCSMHEMERPVELKHWWRLEAGTQLRAHYYRVHLKGQDWIHQV